MKKISVLILTRYESNGASSRVRTLQYLPFLEKLGIQTTLGPLFSNAYLATLYKAEGWSPDRSWSYVATAYVKRLKAVLSARQYDLVWIEKEAFPYLPGIFESILRTLGVPYMVDYDDAIFHNYDLHRSGLVRRLLGKKLTGLLSGARAVTVGNAYLESYVARAGAPKIVRLPSVVDVTRYSCTPDPDGEVFRVGWIGSPSTAQYLSLVVNALRELGRTRKVVLVTVGAPRFEHAGVEVEQHRWSHETETMLLQTIHVGIMPLLDSPWEKGKCGYKLIQYMACGRPVIASPIGINTEIVTPDVGFLAADEEAWIVALKALADNRELRAKMGRAARIKVTNEYSIQATGMKLASLIDRAAKNEL